MPETKYGGHVILEPFQKAAGDFTSGSVFTHTDEDKAGVVFEYHCINQAGWSIKDSRTHDTWELLCFAGGNPQNINDLGAEVSVCLGDEKEEHTINSATIVSIPPGLKHSPVTLKRYSKPFVLLRISTTREYEDKLNSTTGSATVFGIKAMKEGYPITQGSPITQNGKKYWMNIIRGPFFVEAEPGWAGTSIWAHHNEYKNGTTLGYHCINSTYEVPFTHCHDCHELLCFIGGDPENPADLGAEVSVCLGDELEEHVFNTAGIISMPPGLKHCPLTVRNVAKPIVFLEVSMTRDFAAK
ncbi:MAG: hypothetical protein JXA46_19055 [Dehalococcoidales bacterium]|nr:hypothetical protein [Dehalococcoidales bacterium]